MKSLIIFLLIAFMAQACLVDEPQPCPPNPPKAPQPKSDEQFNSFIVQKDYLIIDK